MEESILYIKLAKRPQARDGKTDDGSGERFDDEAKRLIIIDSRLLVKTLSNKTSLLIVYSAIRLVLDSEDLFASDGIIRRRRRDKRPRLIFEKCIDLICHSITPFYMFMGLRTTSGLNVINLS